MSYCTNVGFIPKLLAYLKCFDSYYYILYNIRKKKCICICIGSAGLYIYFGIRTTVKLLKKKKKGYILFWY